jgi:hypothetical protein
VKSFPAFGILLGSRGRASQVRTLLADNSGLPGPRSNLELAYSFAGAVAGMRVDDWLWDFLVEMARTSVANAPENTPKVFLPVCGLMALGALYGGGLPRPRRRAAHGVITGAAADSRWRVREGAAMALQLAGERDPAGLRELVDGWLPAAGPYEMRAIAAGLAHPPLLADPGFASYCVGVARAILAAVSRAGPEERRTDGFTVLRQGMGYAVSVFAAHCPGEGFALLEKSAAVRDPDLAWIVRENLKKKRISNDFPEETARVAAIAAAAAGP